ncbi:MAG: RecX family transcriptional regulator [Chloroflexota bacterium]|nr:RecX family transcriptional regulator [Chloroflexota bacterium]
MTAAGGERPDRPTIEGLVTAIEPQQRRGGKRSNVYVDGRYAFSLPTDMAVALRVGEPMSALKTADLLWKDQVARAYDHALTFLGARPRSEREVRDRLGKHGYPEEITALVIEKLRGLDLIDDTAFAEYWVEQRQLHRPRGARLLRQELRQKGVPAEVVSETLEATPEDAEDAYRSAIRKAQSLRGLDERTFRQRLGAFLHRRGFGYEATSTTVRRLWSELHGEDAADEDWPE